MNIVYLERSEIGALLGRGDRRYAHITKVLRKRAGDTLAAGCSLMLWVLWQTRVINLLNIRMRNQPLRQHQSIAACALTAQEKCF